METKNNIVKKLMKVVKIPPLLREVLPLKKEEVGAEGKRKMFWRVGLVFLAVFFVFFDGHTASAATVDCTSSSARARCTIASRNQEAAVAFTCLDTSRADCAAWCEAQPGWDSATTSCAARDYSSGEGSTGTATVTTTKVVCKDVDDYGLIGNAFYDATKVILYGVFKLLAWLLVAVVSLFAWVIDSKNVSFILGNPGLYASWAMVRDFLNLGFILVLLYIAFCVIFQIGSYSDGWKKMLLMMVIMALLVNFSFPICRFIIDVSNVTFYYLVDAGFGGKDGNEVMTKLMQGSGIQEFTDVTCTTVSFLLAMIVFTFMMMITLAVIAVMFVIRMVALGILVIFSPIGFSGAAFPFSKKYATEWWDSLFKYAFFAPIMIFMIIIAVNIFSSLSRDSFNVVAQKNMGADAGIKPGFIGTMAFFSIPIVILWFGMGMAQKMSIAGASAVTGAAKKAAKWAGSMPWKGAKAGFKATGVPGGVKQKWDNVSKGFKASQASREARIAASGPFKDKNAMERDMRKRATEYEKTETEDDLKVMAKRGDSAAAFALANKGKMDAETLKSSMDSAKDDKIKKAILGKTSETRMDVTLDYKWKMDQAKAANDTTKKNWTSVQETAKDEYGSLTAEEWAKQKDLDKQFSHDPINNPNPHANEIKAGAGAAFGSLDDRAKIEALKRMNGKNSSAIGGAPGVNIPPSGPTPPPPGSGPAPHP